MDTEDFRIGVQNYCFLNDKLCLGRGKYTEQFLTVSFLFTAKGIGVPIFYLLFRFSENYACQVLQLSMRTMSKSLMKSPPIDSSLTYQWCRI